MLGYLVFIYTDPQLLTLGLDGCLTVLVNFFKGMSLCFAAYSSFYIIFLTILLNIRKYLFSIAFLHWNIWNV